MEISFLPADVAHWIEKRVTPPRSAGVHVSELVLAMLQEVGKTHRAWGKEDRPDRSAIYEAGYAWEDALGATLAARLLLADSHRVLPATELGVDEIYGTPDRIIWDYQREGFVLEETKFTWMTCAGLSEDPKALLSEARMQYWVIQTKTYAAMLRHYTVTPADVLVRAPHAMVISPAPPPVAHIRSFFVNGEYRGTLAKPLGWRLEYTNAELDSWWRVVVDYRDRYLAARRATTAPAPTPDPSTDAITQLFTQEPSHAEDRSADSPDDVHPVEGRGPESDSGVRPPR